MTASAPHQASTSTRPPSRARRDPALLVLEDGTVLRGSAYGARGARRGEVVFTTGMTGYQETLSDPSYAGQIVVQTAPHIGNTGANAEDMESRKVWVRRLRGARRQPHHLQLALRAVPGRAPAQQ